MSRRDNAGGGGDGVLEPPRRQSYFGQIQSWGILLRSNTLNRIPLGAAEPHARRNSNCGAPHVAAQFVA